MKLDNMKPKAQFIVLEGLDGSGKSTQVQLLSEKMKSSGIPFLATRQPSDGAVGKMARAATKSGFALENESTALLFAADRYQHYHDEIAPALDSGRLVLCDRYYYSNLAYQGTDADTVKRIISYNQMVMTFRKPDIVFFLDAEPDECMRRILASRDEVSIFETLPKLEQQRERFFSAFDFMKADNIVIIDANNSEAEEIGEKIWSHMYKFNSPGAL